MTANVLTERERCEYECSECSERGKLIPDKGDVRRCEHGEIWYCIRGGYHFHEWIRLSRFWDWRRYRRALAVLGNLDEPQERKTR